MQMTVKGSRGCLVVEALGVSGLILEANLDVGLLIITCPACCCRTLRYLVEGDTFDIKHRSDCPRERAIAELAAQYPERVGESSGTLVFHSGTCSLAVRDSMPLRDELAAQRDAMSTPGLDEAGDGISGTAPPDSPGG